MHKMKDAIPVSVRLATLVPFFCTSLILAAHDSLPLNRHWVMKTGDNPAWAQPEFKVDDWRPIEVGLPWEEAGYEGYDGYAWYRLTFAVPADWKDRVPEGRCTLSAKLNIRFRD